jgi:hypothetical protein
MQTIAKSRLTKTIIRELTTRANHSPRNRIAAEFISTLKTAKQSHVPLLQPCQLNATSLEETAMSDDELVRDYMACLGELLTLEQWKQRELEIKELEKQSRNGLSVNHDIVGGELEQPAQAGFVFQNGISIP